MSSRNLRSDIAEEDADYGVDFVLAAVHKPQVVENIYYDFDKAALRPESKTALDEDGHTSQRKSERHDRDGGAYGPRRNRRIQYRSFRRRAKSVVDYLVDAGIAPDRLSWKGYGKSMPKRLPNASTRSTRSLRKRLC